jgi:hypothetical protein
MLDDHFSTYLIDCPNATLVAAIHRPTLNAVQQSGSAEYRWAYGGTRLTPFWGEGFYPSKSLTASENLIKARQLAIELAAYESHIKQTLGNQFRAQCETGNEKLTEALRQVNVAGGRVIVVPKTREFYRIMNNPIDPKFRGTTDVFLEKLGHFLNGQVPGFVLNGDGKVQGSGEFLIPGVLKNTPDFGRMSGVADLLYGYTHHVLGISRDHGGGGGKSLYSALSIHGALERLIQLQWGEGCRHHNPATTPVTVIGSEGALGQHVLEYLAQKGYSNVRFCDLVDPKSDIPRLATWKRIAAQKKRFTPEALSLPRSGIIIATTWGHELENSDYHLIPEGSLLLLAHNNAFPTGAAGMELANTLEGRGVVAVPGQMLTFGGAFNSVIEWFARVNNIQPYPKPEAKRLIQDMAHKLMEASHQEIGPPLGYLTSQSQELALYR